jgi:hypothetical protein
MSALPPKADMQRRERHVRFVPEDDRVIRLSSLQQIREEQPDRVALVGAVAASIGVEVAFLFERIELGFSQADGSTADSVAAALAVRSYPLCRGGTSFSPHGTCYSLATSSIGWPSP